MLAFGIEPKTREDGTPKGCVSITYRIFQIICLRGQDLLKTLLLVLGYNLVMCADNHCHQHYNYFRLATKDEIFRLSYRETDVRPTDRPTSFRSHLP